MSDIVAVIPSELIEECKEGIRPPKLIPHSWAFGLNDKLSWNDFKSKRIDGHVRDRNSTILKRFDVCDYLTMVVGSAVGFAFGYAAAFCVCIGLYFVGLFSSWVVWLIMNLLPSAGAVLGFKIDYDRILELKHVR